MPRILSVIAGMLVVATTASLSAQQQVITAGARRLGLRAVIQGTAVNANNSVLANTVVRLRDARLGRIVDKSLTDNVGTYTFKNLDPGNYVVELVSNSQTTLAATNLITVNAGETVTAVVKLPFSPSLLGALLRQQSSAVATSLGGLGSSSATAGIGQLPQALVQAIPAVVPVGHPASEQ